MRKNKKPTHAQTIKAIAKAHGKDILPEVKLPRKRKKETKPRAKYKRIEDDIRNTIIHILRKKGIIVYRIENAICGRRNTGIPDLLTFNLRTQRMAWIEVKSPKGKLQDNQKKFQQYCKSCDIDFYVIRSETEAVLRLT